MPFKHQIILIFIYISTEIPWQGIDFRFLVSSKTRVRLDSGIGLRCLRAFHALRPAVTAAI